VTPRATVSEKKRSSSYWTVPVTLLSMFLVGILLGWCAHPRYADAYQVGFIAGVKSMATITYDVEHRGKK